MRQKMGFTGKGTDEENDHTLILPKKKNKLKFFPLLNVVSIFQWPNQDLLQGLEGTTKPKVMEITR